MKRLVSAEADAKVPVTDISAKEVSAEESDKLATKPKKEEGQEAEALLRFQLCYLSFSRCLLSIWFVSLGSTYPPTRRDTEISESDRPPSGKGKR